MVGGDGVVTSVVRSPASTHRSPVARGLEGGMIGVEEILWREFFGNLLK